MTVTTDIVRDLLPLYVAGEASADSRAAVEAWLKADAVLAREAALLREDAEPPAAPRPPDAQREVLARTKALLRTRTWLLAGAVLLTGLPFTIVFRGGRITFFMLRDAPGTAAALGVGAVLLWVAYALTARRLRVSGL